jgi:hypothetical protein
MHNAFPSAALAAALIIGSPVLAAPPRLPPGWTIVGRILTWTADRRVPMGDARSAWA